jgi:hypothetical protein
MVKVLARAGVVVLLPAPAQPGNSSSWGMGAVIPALAQRPLPELQTSGDIPNRRRAEWLRQHGKGLFPFFH